MMHVSCGAIIFIWTASCLTSATVLSGTVQNDTRFVPGRFPAGSALRVTVRYRVRSRTNLPVRLDIYTTENQSQMDRNCSSAKRSQLGNSRLHVDVQQDGQDASSEELDLRDKGTTDNLSVKEGTIIIQDFVPRMFSFSLSLPCHSNDSLQGVHYEIELKEEANETKCLDTPVDELRCSDFFTKVSFPNLLGDTRDSAKERVRNILRINRALSEKSEKTVLSVYQHMREAVCHLIYPKCNTSSHAAVCTVPACKETCKIARESCRVSHETFYTVLGDLNCDYLPSVDDPNTQCFFKPVICGPPSLPENTRIVKGLLENISYTLKHEIQYSCVDESMQMFGTETVKCRHSGAWSTPPMCRHKSTSAVLWGVAGGFCLVISLVILFSYLKSSSKSRTRNKKYDAFVCYNFDANWTYVTETILPQLEQNLDPALLLCVCDRDFLPGDYIHNNIRHAVQNSNSAIIVMSQEFVDSPWCKGEFECCIQENMLHPEFRLFVIMMQPVHELQGTTDSMKQFFQSRLYLQREDPMLFQRIAHCLRNLRGSDSEEQS